jgi:FkbM family methyltransferase
MLRDLAESLLPPGLLIRLSALDHYLRGEPEIRLLRRLCEGKDVAVDVGANIGTYTFFMSRYAKRTIAYEPNPGLAARLADLFPTVVVRNVALSNRERTLELLVPVSNGRSAHELGSISQGFDDAQEVQRHVVRCVTLDSEDIGNLGFLKIDVEQHEREVLQGAIQTIRRCRPVIMTETTPLLYSAPLDETFGFVIDLGYRGWATFQDRLLAFDELKPDVHLNPGQFGRTFINTNVFFFPSDVDPRMLFGARRTR